MFEQKRRSFSMFEICGWIGCDCCAGDADCACLAVYRRKYGDGFNAAARGDLDVWFPRAATVATSDVKTPASEFLGAVEKVHDRLVHGGFERIARAAEAEQAMRRGRRPAWVKRGGV